MAQRLFAHNVYHAIWTRRTTDWPLKAVGKNSPFLRFVEAALPSELQHRDHYDEPMSIRGAVNKMLAEIQT